MMTWWWWYQWWWWRRKWMTMMTWWCHDDYDQHHQHPVTLPSISLSYHHLMMTWWWWRRWRWCWRWWWHGDDAVVMTWWHDDMMTWCHDRAVPLIQTSTAIELYKGQNSCVDCNFTLHHCKFPVLPDPLIVNLQCAGPQHCKLTVGTTCERDPKEMDFTMGIQWFYSGHTVYLQCVHCKIIQCRELLTPLPL